MFEELRHGLTTTKYVKEKEGDFGKLKRSNPSPES
jgi:hypothetical protein